MDISYQTVKNILYNTKSREWFGTDYTMNLYRGCNLGCIYCDSRSDCYRIDNFDVVQAKKHSIQLLERELKRKKNGVIGFGSMSDPYNHLEKQTLITKEALTMIERYQFGAVLSTKSNMILRDIDILKKVNQHASLLVGFSITTTDDPLCKKIERNAPSASQRFEAMKVLSEQGIYTGTIMMPVIPFITSDKDNIMSIIQKTYASGGKFIYPWFALSLRDSQRHYFYQWLEKIFPGLKNTYQNTYKNNYLCYPRNHEILQDLFITECEKLGIKYKMGDIIASYQSKYDAGQLDLF
ncbi:SPL family radical SAM protein [Serratia ureilytica]|uniref:SPL family radical SAM protein n=1 Tax=Serratia ureilytica TaxID=300181 RepID=UPI0019D0824F|nr:radical SAM protein [Serratia ureilytica]MBN5218044.1 radical SAM protein [Serratia ureilytica]